MRPGPVIAAITCMLTVPSAAAEPALDRLAPHRAVYEVTLSEASERSGITSIKGRMVYESRGAACDGFSVRFRFFQNVRTARREYSSDQRTTTFESADGQRFDFVNRTFFNGTEEREVRGSAVRSQSGIDVTLQKPDAAEISLPLALFPSRHIALVLGSALAGKRIVAAEVFDGSDDGDAAMTTNAIIGRRAAPGQALSGAFAKLQGLVSWPVNVAYFGGAPDASGERLPTYQVSFPLYENGVSGNLVMRYDDYTLKAQLSDLSYLERPDCAER